MKKITNLTHIGIKKGTKILGCFPHPDDESVFSGGFFHKASKMGVLIKIACVTNGDKGTKYLKNIDSSTLAGIRKDELQEALKHLGIKGLLLGNFPDGEIKNDFKEVYKFIEKLVVSFRPEFVLTLEPDGIYGHPDHIALSKIVTQIYLDSNKKFRLIYSTVPLNFQPSHEALKMAEQPEQISPIKPNLFFKLSIGDIWAKMQALKSHRSQFKTDLNFWESWRQRKILQSEYFYIVE